MSKYKILIPLDTSNFSWQIIPIVLKFLPAAESKLILLRVGKPPEKLAVSDADSFGKHAMPEHLGQFGVAPDINLPRSNEPVVQAGSPEHKVTEIQAEEGLKEALADELHDVLWPLRNAGHDVLLVVRLGDNPGAEIAEYATKEEVDMIAMATHGRSGLNKLLHGSVAERVLQNVSIPVLLLPQPNA